MSIEDAALHAHRRLTLYAHHHYLYYNATKNRQDGLCSHTTTAVISTASEETVLQQPSIQRQAGLTSSLLWRTAAHLIYQYHQPT